MTAGEGFHCEPCFAPADKKRASAKGSQFFCAFRNRTQENVLPFLKIKPSDANKSESICRELRFAWRTGTRGRRAVRDADDIKIPSVKPQDLGAIRLRQDDKRGAFAVKETLQHQTQGTPRSIPHRPRQKVVFPQMNAVHDKNDGGIRPPEKIPEQLRQRAQMICMDNVGTPSVHRPRRTFAAGGEKNAVFTLRWQSVRQLPQIFAAAANCRSVNQKSNAHKTTHLSSTSRAFCRREEEWSSAPSIPAKSFDPTNNTDTTIKEHRA